MGLPETSMEQPEKPSRGRVFWLFVPAIWLLGGPLLGDLSEDRAAGINLVGFVLTALFACVVVVLLAQ
jgi:hypothetical protein